MASEPYQFVEMPGSLVQVADANEGLLADRNAVIGSNVLRLHALATVADALARDCIELIALKGAALLGGEYADLSQRSMCDVDVLVHPRNWDRALAALERLGARDGGTAAGRPATVESYFEAAYVLPLGPSVFVSVDLHRRLTWNSAFPVDVDELFLAAVPHPLPDLAQKGVLRLGPEHFVLHLALHRFQHQYDGDLRNYVDAERIASDPGLDAGELVDAARRYGLQTVLFEFLRRGQSAGIIHGVSDIIDELRPRGLRAAALRAAGSVRMPGKLKQLALFWSCCHRPVAAVSFPMWYLGVRVADLARSAAARRNPEPKKAGLE